VKYGALQSFKEHFASAEEIGSSQFVVDDVHKIGILDIRLLNLDRHLGNLLVSKDSGTGALRLIPIDHGYILPDFRNTSDVSFEWLHWKQCKVPFSPASKVYIDKLDAIADAIILKKIGIRDEHIMTLILSTTLLRLGAKRGLCLFDIANMIQRNGTKETKALFELMTEEAGREADELLRAHQSKIQKAEHRRQEKRNAQEKRISTASRTAKSPVPPSITTTKSSTAFVPTASAASTATGADDRVPESPMASPYFSTFFSESPTSPSEEKSPSSEQSLVVFGIAATEQSKTQSPKIRFTLFLEAFIKIAHREIDSTIQRSVK